MPAGPPGDGSPGWACCGRGGIMNGRPQCIVDNHRACFKHSQPVHAEDVVRMKVEEGGDAYVGFAGQHYDPKKDGEMHKGTAYVELGNGSTFIGAALSLNGEYYFHAIHLQDHIPETKPYDVALRCDKDGNVPQIQFNDDGVWHDFAPEDRTGLVAGPWFPYLDLAFGDRVSDSNTDSKTNAAAADGAAGFAVAEAGAEPSDGAAITVAQKTAAAAAVVDGPTGGWEYDTARGKVLNGQPQWSEGGDYAYFKHSQPVNAEDAFKMRVEVGNAVVGFAGQQYDPKKDGATGKSTAWVRLGNGSTCINSGLSQDEQRHYHQAQLRLHIPETKPYDVALRCDKDGNVPQIQFNDDGVWHDFAPEGRTGLVAGPWFPYVMLYKSDRVKDLRVHNSRPTTSAGTKRKFTSSPTLSPADEGGRASASDDHKESDQPPLKKVL